MRRGNVNEAYYAKNNDINFRDFGRNYHFVDDQQRQYRIAVQSDQIFAARRLRIDDAQPPYRCVVDLWGYVRLYVKLPRPGIEWFSADDVDRPLDLYPRGYPGTTITVAVRQLEKPSAKRRTGIVYVSGLSADVCDALLNPTG